MAKFFAFILGASLCLLAPLSFAQEDIVVKESTNFEAVEKPQETIKPLTKEQQPQTDR